MVKTLTSHGEDKIKKYEDIKKAAIENDDGRDQEDIDKIVERCDTVIAQVKEQTPPAPINLPSVEENKNKSDKYISGDNYFKVGKS